ncbi:hypothetical protein CQW23_23416 [Capsicum baccatum]|nr:hypothetical protein CQW23_23416 [Capsicum baccatum]
MVQLQAAELDKENEKWRKADILYVAGDSPSIGALERVIVGQWNFTAKPKVTTIMRGPSPNDWKKARGKLVAKHKTQMALLTTPITNDYSYN